MISLLAFLIALAALFLEGWLLGRLMIRDRVLPWLFALPLAALANTLIFLLYTVLDLPLSPAMLGVGHVIIIGFFFLLYWKTRVTPSGAEGRHESIVMGSAPLTMTLRIICTLLLSIIALFSFTHAIVLHTFSIDSFTNWTMRSQISFEDQSMAFDKTEERGMAKPQYPFLTHALQIAANQGQRAWNDRAANAATWLLTASCFGAAFVLLRRMRGTDAALLALTFILGIPLLSIHLAQGYGDVHLVEYLLLSFLTLVLFLETKSAPWLILSSAMTAGALWTKSEGLTFAFVPWTLILLAGAVIWGHRYRPALLAIAGTFLLYLPFPIILLALGLPLTPHSSDMQFAWHPEGLRALLSSLFALGSFGIAWYALPAASTLLLWQAKDQAPRTALLLAWGWFIVAENLVIYLCTPNVRFLLDGQSFFRQMLPAAALIIIGCALAYRPHART